MHHKIRITVVSLVAMMVCMLNSATTLSYFTDTDEVVNNFVVGNASTALVIYDDVTGGRRELDVSRYPITDGDIPFYLQATNDGNVSVYQRFRVVIPSALANVMTLVLPNMGSCEVETASTHMCSNANYTATYNPAVNGNAVYYIVSNGVIAKEGTTSEWPTEKMRISGISSVPNSNLQCSDNTRNNCVLGIRVYSDAVQSTGFEDAGEVFTNFTETY